MRFRKNRLIDHQSPSPVTSAVSLPAHPAEHSHEAKPVAHTLAAVPAVRPQDGQPAKNAVRKNQRDPKHYRARKDLPARSIIPDLDRHRHPRPNAKPIGTYGPKRREVFRAKDCSELMSRSAWRSCGYKVISDKPVAERSNRYKRYAVYGDWQVAEQITRPISPPKDLGDGELLRALWTLNRQAKRYRDRAQDHYERRRYKAATRARISKERVYETKSLVLAVLHSRGCISLAGVTDGDPTFAVFKGYGYTFHCPKGKWHSDQVVAFDGQVEAKPRASCEMRIRDAWATVNGFLARNGATDEEKGIAASAVLPKRPRVCRWTFDDDGDWFDRFDDDDCDWD